MKSNEMTGGELVKFLFWFRENQNEESMEQVLSLMERSMGFASIIHATIIKGWKWEGDFANRIKEKYELLNKK